MTYDRLTLRVVDHDSFNVILSLSKDEREGKGDVVMIIYKKDERGGIS